MLWIVRDAWVSFRGRLVGVVLLDIGAVAAASAAFAGLYLLARGVESGVGIGVGPLTFDPRASIPAVVGSAGALALLGVGSAGLVYLTDWLAAGLAIDHAERLLHRVLSAAGDPELRGGTAFVDPPGRSGVLRLAATCPRIASLVLRQLVKSALPAATLLAGGTVLMAMQPLLSILLLPLAALYTIPLYRVSRRAAAADVAFRRQQAAAKRRVVDLVDDLQANALEGSERKERVREVVTGAEQRASGRHYFERRLAPDRAQLLNTVFFLGVVFVAFAYFAAMGTTGESVWSDLLLYVVALRFTLGGLRGVTGTVVLASRFAPRLVHLVGFLEGTAALRAHRGSTDGMGANGALTVRWGRGEGDGAPGGALTLRPGRFLWVFGAGRGALSADAAALVVGAAADPALDLLADSARRVTVLEARDLSRLDPEALEARIVSGGNGYVLMCAPHPSYCLRPVYRGVEDRCVGGVLLSRNRIVEGGDVAWMHRRAEENGADPPLDDDGEDDELEDED